MSYSIEGTIDALDLFDDTLRFSLLPSNGCLVSCDDGNKKVLFIDSNLHNAILIDHDKNVNGKEIVWFSFNKELRDVFLSAKNNRSTIRVWCEDLEKKDSGTKVQASPIRMMKAEGVRVF